MGLLVTRTSADNPSVESSPTFLPKLMPPASADKKKEEVGNGVSLVGAEGRAEQQGLSPQGK